MVLISSMLVSASPSSHLETILGEGYSAKHSVFSSAALLRGDGNEKNVIGYVKQTSSGLLRQGGSMGITPKKGASACAPPQCQEERTPGDVLAHLVTKEHGN